VLDDVSFRPATPADSVGMMALSREAHVRWIDQLYLRPSAVGKGLGTRLVERAKAEWS
jgi:GNAT superfamily N-acetyltransferase